MQSFQQTKYCAVNKQQQLKGRKKQKHISVNKLRQRSIMTKTNDKISIKKKKKSPAQLCPL